MYKITVNGNGQGFTCREDQFIIDAMIHSRVGPVHYGCCAGGCGICRMQVLSGRYEIVKRMSTAHISQDDLSRHIVLICCIQPRGDLTIARVENKSKRGNENGI